MLNGFESHTAPLKDNDIEVLVPLFVKSFKKRIGKDNAASSTEIIKAFREKYNVELTDTKVRQVVNHIRNNALLPGLVASSRGYYVTNSEHEVRRYLQSLDSRINEIIKVRDGMRAYLKSITHRKQSELYQ